MRLASVFSLSVVVATGCASATIGDSVGDSDVQLNSELRLLENHPNCEDVEVAADSLTYLWATDASGVDVEVGSILVGAKGGGYVRRVSSVDASGTTLTVGTEPASLADAIVAGDMVMPLVPGDGWAQCPDGVACSLLDVIDISGTVLFDGDVGGVPLRVTIPTGTLQFSPSVDFEMNVGFPGRIKHLSGLVTGAFTADIQVEAETGGAINFAEEIDVSGPAAPLYSYPFTFVAPTPLGPLPIVGTANLDVFVGFRAGAAASASVSTGVTANAQVSIGASYDDGEWTATAEPSIDAQLHPIEFDSQASASVEAYARPEVNVVFYGVAGPRFAVEPLVRLTGDLAPPAPLHTRLEACLRGEIGFSVEILSFSLADFSRSLERCMTLFDSNGQPLVDSDLGDEIVLDTDADTAADAVAVSSEG
jgi:hypothetical protein